MQYCLLIAKSKTKKKMKKKITHQFLIINLKNQKV